MYGLRIVTYNAHGFNQAAQYLQEICAEQAFDIIFLQELWLTPANWNKITELSPNYLCFGTSAMYDTVSSGILVGRPYGGTAILINKQISKSVKCILSSDKIVAVTLNDCLFINVSMPCNDGTMKASDLVVEILSITSDLIETQGKQFVFFGGDINVDLSARSQHVEFINKFLYERNLVVGSSNLNGGTFVDVEHTFSNDKLGRFS